MFPQCSPNKKEYNMKKIRNLKPDEIEVRYGNKLKDGRVNMLLYIDSRAAVQLLDETYGMQNWGISYKEVAGQIYGRLEIFDEEAQRWVYREDTGSESNIEAQKGLSSDILKRCLARFGCNGLYSSPKITIQESEAYGLEVDAVEWDDKGKMKFLSISRPAVGGGRKPIFTWKRDTMFPTTPQAHDYTSNATQTEPFEVMCETQTTPPDFATLNAPKIEELSQFGKRVKTDENKAELTKFMLYYRDKVLSKKEWTGSFNPESLWKGWCERNAKRAS